MESLELYSVDRPGRHPTRGGVGSAVSVEGHISADDGPRVSLKLVTELVAVLLLKVLVRTGSLLKLLPWISVFLIAATLSRSKK